MALTDKQKRFCDEYLVDMNATQAAIRAGYSKKTAKVIGRQNLTKLNLREYIDKRLAEKEASLIADQDEVLKYLSSVMRREKEDSVVVTLSQEESTYEPDEQGKMRKHTRKVDVPKIVSIPAQLRDANKAAELLGKAHGIFTEKINLGGDVNVVLVDDIEDDED